MVLTGNEQEETGVDCQRGDILDEGFQFDRLVAEFVEIPEPLVVFLGHKSSGCHLKAIYRWSEIGDISQEIGIFPFLSFVRSLDIGLIRRRQLPDMEAVLFPVKDADVRPVAGDDAGLQRDGAACVVLVPRQVGVHLEPGLVKALDNVSQNIIVPPGPAALI